MSTDEIVPGGVTGLSLWSSLPGMTSLAFKPIDESYVDRARDCHGDGHAIIVHCQQLGLRFVEKKERM